VCLAESKFFIRQMSSKITLIITQGKLPGKQYIFENPTIYIIGKNSDCHLKLPNDKEHEDILEYHCLLDINPPQIRGTNRPYELKTGDTIKLGVPYFNADVPAGGRNRKVLRASKYRRSHRLWATIL